MYRIFLSLLLFALVTGTASAQYTREDINNKPDSTEEKSLGDFASRITFGGGLFARFGDETAINVSPRVGYLFTKRLNAGVSINYTEYINKVFPEFDYRLFGYGPFANYDVLRNFKSFPDIYLGGEFTNMHVTYHDELLNEITTTIQMMFVGGGVRVSLGGRAYVFAELMYDVLENSLIIYNNPRLNIGIIVR